MFHVNEEQKPVCRQIFAEIIPNLEKSNPFNTKMMNLLLKFTLNPEYLNVSMKDKLSPLFQTRICSNGSLKHILLIRGVKGKFVDIDE